MYLEPLYDNPRRRRRRYYGGYRRRRRNPGGFSHRVANPQVLGVDLGEAGGTIAGAIGTAYTDSALVGPMLGNMLGAAGQFKPAVQALVSAFGFHWILRRVSPRYARSTAGGGALYAVVGMLNTVAPGLVPITIGVPTQLAGLRPLAALQPPAASGGGATPSAPISGGTSSQTGGLRIMSRSGL